MPQFLVFPVAILSQDVVMEGRTTTEFCCPCTEASAPRGVSFWVELVGLPGFPSILEGRCARCGDRWVACAESTLLGWYGVQRWVPGKGVEFGGQRWGALPGRLVLPVQPYGIFWAFSNHQIR